MGKLILVLNFVVLVANVMRAERCIRRGITGECVDLTECPELRNMAYNRDRAPGETKLLQDCYCGGDTNMVKVCCPYQCRTPENQLGDCMQITSCLHMAERIKEPVTAANLAYISSAICEGRDPYSVCCASPHTPSVTDIQNGFCTPLTTILDHNSGCCGREMKMESKIIAGAAAAIDQFPWMALIEYETYDANTNPLQCGGSLISARYVLTAAHCLSIRTLGTIGRPKLVRLGEYDTANEGKDCVLAAGGGKDCTYGVIKINIEKSIPHPNFRLSNRRNDIGLIKLEKNANFNEFIFPICLPTSDISLTLPRQADKDNLFYVSGWGRIDDYTAFSPIKQYTNVSFMDTQGCLSWYKERGRSLLHVICAGSSNGHDTCWGDSGGPLMYEKDQVYQVTGVTSFGPKPCGQLNVPGVYTNVYHYRDWILKTIVE